MEKETLVVKPPRPLSTSLAKPLPRKPTLKDPRGNLNEVRGTLVGAKHTSQLHFVLGLREGLTASTPQRPNPGQLGGTLDRPTECFSRKVEAPKEKLVDIAALAPLIASKARPSPANLSGYFFEAGLRDSGKPPRPFRNFGSLAYNPNCPTLAPPVKIPRDPLALLDDGRRNLKSFSVQEKENRARLPNRALLGPLLLPAPGPMTNWLAGLREAKSTEKKEKIKR